LHDCQLLDGAKGLAAALSLLPGLQHLSISIGFRVMDALSTDVLLGLLHLTRLDLLCAVEAGIGQPGPALQPLQSLTRLVALRLSLTHTAAIHHSMVTGMHHLSRLHLAVYAEPKPGALATLTQLQHLSLALVGNLVRTATWATQLLSELPHLQQLTHLGLRKSIDVIDSNVPAAAFTALTASSKLQHLDISWCRLPAGVWQHVFPAGRQLPHLQALNVSWVIETSGRPATAPEGTRLVSCCSGLRSLDMPHMHYSTELLAPLKRLSGLRTLLLEAVASTHGLEVVGQLTGLQNLHLKDLHSAQGVLLPLTQLRQLTNLSYTGRRVGMPLALVHRFDMVSWVLEFMHHQSQKNLDARLATTWASYLPHDLPQAIDWTKHAHRDASPRW
jgi:hypothetical protein